MYPRKGLLEELKRFAKKNDKNKKIVATIFNQLMEYHEIDASYDGVMHVKTIQLLIEDNKLTYLDIGIIVGVSESKLKRDIKKYNIIIQNIIVNLIKKKKYQTLKKIVKR